jgi:hypothetical protein
MEESNVDQRLHELIVDVAVLKTRMDESVINRDRQAIENERRLYELNQSQDRADRVLATYITRDSFEQTVGEWTAWRRVVDSELSISRGRSTGLEKGWGWIIGFVTVAAAVAGAIGAFIGHST